MDALHSITFNEKREDENKALKRVVIFEKYNWYTEIRPLLYEWGMAEMVNDNNKMFEVVGDMSARLEKLGLTFADMFDLYHTHLDKGHKEIKI